MKKIIITVSACLLFAMASAQDTTATKKPSTTRSSLTGDWGGARESLKMNGLVIEPRVTFFQHNYVAGEGYNESVFSGKADLMIKFNGVKLGLKRWTLITHLEQNFGKSLNGKGGTLIPNNIATTFPGLDGNESFDITSLHLVYQFGKANALMIGKINMVDIAAGTRFSGGAGIDALWNVNFPGPVSGITPPYMLGAITSIKTKALKYTFMVYDPANYANQSVFKSSFETGITFSGSIEKEATIWGKKGSHSLRAAYSTQDGTDLYDLGDLILPTPESAGRKNSRWYFNYNINQPFVDYEEKGKGWGLFGMVSISDGNPNPIHFGMHLGIGGNSFFKNRSDDKWGLAMYHYSLSNPLADFASTLGKPLRNETGVELFYQAWLTKWFSLGGDVQWINPILKNNPGALFLGLRSSIKI
ncbi:carbohydrate porin [Flavobacterium sp.]|uniref:carbohydrate porin n=1 Tax=Flavobacterium sp. TaxID=239 RepID=UPI00286A520F|nr:carbohydrate porin [Flavobacterium sp.]